MQPKTTKRWQFSTSVLLPVVLVLAITAASVVAFILWSAANIDQRALERQNTMVARVMEAKRQQVKHDLASVAVWDDALANVLDYDFDWVDFNLGEWVHSYFGHDRSVVFDTENTAIYMMKDGKSVPTAEFADISAQVMPMARQVRAAAANNTTATQPSSLSDFAVVEGRPAIIAVMTMLTDTGDIVQTPGSEPLLAAVYFLDSGVARQMNHQLLLDAGHFTLAEHGYGAHGVHPVFNLSGRFVAFFDWQPDRPGLLMLQQTGPALAAAFIVAGVLVFLLLRQLSRSSAALESGRRNAEYQAAHDKLTGLPNRGSFDDHLSSVLGKRDKAGAHVSLLMLDLDRFKQVNDTLGHQAGDELIAAVGLRIRAVADDGIVLARLGGDEFALLAVSQDNSLDMMALSARIIETVGQPFSIGHYKAHVGVSIGIVNAQMGDNDPRELIRKADIALYEAKAGGRNRAVTYEEHMNELLQLQHTIEGQLREALRQKDQLSVAFQPLVCQVTRKVVGAETLARWTHPKYGQISPARFIPVAENTGLIEALGDFVLRRACEMGATVPGRTIAVNISPTQLRNPSFTNLVFDILHQTGMRPVDLELEITESILLDEEVISANNLRTLRAAGIHLALDDFGTGYSSLSYLKRYPVDRIKIDRSFVSQLTKGHVSVAIVQAIINLAHAMDIDVTAEGVETEEQAMILGELGNNILQGFLFSGAMSPAKISETFADANNAPARRRRRA